MDDDKISTASVSKLQCKGSKICTYILSEKWQEANCSSKKEQVIQNHDKQVREAYVTCCDLSPWMLVAGNWFWHNQYSNASAPLLVSTKTKVRACWKTKVRISVILRTEKSQTKIINKGWEVGKKKSDFESIFKPGYWLLNLQKSIETAH